MVVGGGDTWGSGVQRADTMGSTMTSPACRNKWLSVLQLAIISHPLILEAAELLSPSAALLTESLL